MLPSSVDPGQLCNRGTHIIVHSVKANAKIAVAIAPLELEIVFKNEETTITGVGNGNVKLYQLVSLGDVDSVVRIDHFSLATGEIKQRGVHGLVRFCTGGLCPAAASQQQGRRQN